MCAGDLGMYRVMPWSYPPISGGSSGGFSPNPGSDVSGEHTFISGENTKINVVSAKVYGSGSSNKIELYLTLSQFEISNSSNIDHIGFEIDIKSLILADDTNVLTNIITNPVISLNTWNPPLDSFVNAGSVADVTFYPESTITYTNQQVKSLSADLRINTYNADGKVIRTDVFTVTK